MVSFDGHKGDPCLMHPDASHDMETCSTVEELLQQMMDQGRFEISEENKGEQNVCMQLADKESPAKPKPLVIHFTRDVASRNPEILDLSRVANLSPSLTKATRWSRGDTPLRSQAKRKRRPLALTYFLPKLPTSPA